jgi:hypothetical protein
MRGLLLQGSDEGGQRITEQSHEPSRGRSTAEAAFNELKKEITQRRERASHGKNGERGSQQWRCSSAVPRGWLGGHVFSSPARTVGRVRIVRRLSLIHRSFFRAAGTVVAALAALIGAGAAPASTAPQAVAAATSCVVSAPPGSPAPVFLSRVCNYLSGRQGVVQIAVFDRNTGRSYLVSDGPDEQVTASIVKVDILAQWLHSYQHHGTRIPGQIPYSIQFLMQQMIEFSDNAAATALFYFHGGCNTLTRFNELIPLKATRVMCQSRSYYGWGNTTTTAADQVALMRLIAYGGSTSVLAPAARRYELSLLKKVSPGENWGISCGPWQCSRARPATPDVILRSVIKPVRGTIVAVKNGWKTLPTCRRAVTKCPWQVNSTGWVRGRGRDYVLTVLTTHDPVGVNYGFNYGVDTIEHVSALVWANLT